jgi:two-component system nitrogen regulation response regulator GlnG
MTTETKPELSGHILVADDEESLRWVLERFLTQQGHTVVAVPDGTAALAELQRQTFDVALMDISMPGTTGLDVLTTIRGTGSETSCIVMTAQSTMANAIEATKRGAYDYLPKPFELDHLGVLVQRALTLRRLSRDLQRLRGELREQEDHLVGSSPAMQETFKTIGRVAPTDATVLIRGETGTGKELVAKTIHRHSDRRGAFWAISCSAIPSELLESELFGHERGAFTGAIERRLGKFELAEGGTLFLDEIADMPVTLQAKLLRVLQEREYTRLGGRDRLVADVRIIAATNRDLEAAMAAGLFREDLYYRLNVVTLALAPLRERRGDVPPLIDFFLAKMNRRLGMRILGLSEDARALLVGHTWPGNVRELENTLLRAAVLAGGQRPLLPDDFVLGGAAARPSGPPVPIDVAVTQRALDLLQPDGGRARDLYGAILADVERALLAAVLQHTGGNQVKAADILGINRNTLRKKLTDLDLQIPKVDPE